VLRSSIREFLCSEAMHHLGVPTTRALSLVATGEGVVRDMFYDGNPQVEPGAIVCRVAPTFLRFGNFELCASRGDHALLKRLADYTLEHFFPQLGAPGPGAYAALYAEVARRTARLMAHWQAVGFVHGVMNTDNMSILGLTIDYGPYGWVDNYDPDWTPNTTDAEQRRYRYGNQPGIGLWNVERLGVALLPLLEGEEALLAGLREYEEALASALAERYAAKLGLRSLTQEGDLELLQGCLGWLAEEETDMTLFFRGLSRVVLAESAPAEFPAGLREAFYGTPSAAHLGQGVQWLAAWWRRTRREGTAPAELARRMNAANPQYVLRNWLAQEAIDAAHAGDDSKVHALLEVMRRPYEEQPGREHYAARRPDWARRKPGCSALSCSS
jgi:serine/tyrosine/threonine adenylyltransferase